MKLLRKIKDFTFEQKMKRQRVQRGFSDNDAWDLDSWFMHIIPEMIKYVKDNGMGYPGIVINDFIEIKNITDKEYIFGLVHHCGIDDKLLDECDKWCNNRWQEILGKMIFLFYECDDDTCTYHNKYDEVYLEQRSESKSENKEYKDLKKLWNEEESKIDKYKENCKREALELFVKYLDCLWC